METMLKTSAPAEVLDKLVPDVLERMFGDQAYHYDLVAGTVLGLNDTRVIYLSADLIHGIHGALQHEVGDAWKVVLKNCGYIWGKRVSAALNPQLRAMVHEDLDTLSLRDYLNLLRSYFAKHGWGKLDIHLDDAQSHGIVRVSLTHSLFVEALKHVEGRVDHMIAGMLRGLFEAVSGRALDCIQVVCARANPGKASVFLVSAPERIKNIEAIVDGGVAVNDAIRHLRDA